MITAAVGYGLQDHLCWLYEDEPAWVQAAVSYLAEGAQAHDQLLYVADKPEGELVADLVDLPGRDAMLASGQLRVVPLRDVYGSMDVFEAARQIESYRAQGQAAVEAGYRGLRLAAEASPLVATPEDARYFAGYELLVDAAIAECPISAMCGYCRSLVGPDAARVLSFVHPLRHDVEHAPVGSLHAGDGGRWHLEGEIDLTSHDALEIGLSALPAQTDLHLDLSDLGFIDLGGAQALAGLGRQLAPTRRLVLHEPPAVLERVLGLAWPDAPGLELAVGPR